MDASLLSGLPPGAHFLLARRMILLQKLYTLSMVFLVLFLLLFPSVASPVEWTADGIHFELTKEDFRAWRGKEEPIFSVRQYFEQSEREFEAQVEEDAAEFAKTGSVFGSPEISKSLVIEPLSVVGSIVSYLEGGDGYSYGAAHPYSYQRIVTKDLAKNEEASLLNYYSEKVIIGALKQDRWIKRFNVHQEAFHSTETLKRFVELLNDAVYESQDLESCAMDAYFEEVMLRRFAFYDVRDKQVAVRIGVSYGSEVCRGTFHQIGIWLPIPEKLRLDLDQAKSLKAGFVMSNRKKLGRFEYRETWERNLQAETR